MTPAPTRTPPCCTTCCSQDMPVLQVGHQSAPKENALRLRLKENATTRAAPMMTSSVTLRVVADRAITGTTKHAKTNRSLKKAALSDGTRGNPVANASIRFDTNIGTLTVNATNASFASSRCERFNGLINQSWSTP